MQLLLSCTIQSDQIKSGIQGSLQRRVDSRASMTQSRIRQIIKARYIRWGILRFASIRYSICELMCLHIFLSPS
jgi:hypothetical protein